jgi:choice-of-anchor C domain-containing protein
MRITILRPLALAGLVAGLCVAPASRAQMLANGNFELGPAIPDANPILSVAPGGGALTGWTVVGGAINVITDGYWVPLSGHRSIVLSSSGPGAIEQVLSTAPGAIYRLTFWMSGEAFSTPTIKHLRITAGANVLDQTYDITGAWHWDMAWSKRTFDFTAAGSSTTLRLASMDATQWGPALDSMKVELVSAGVPGVPATLAFAPVAPDPVRDAGRMTFTLAQAGHVRLAVHDIQGRQVALLANTDLDAGPHGVDFSPGAWNARPGLYLATLQVAGQALVRRFSVLP